MIDHPNGFAKEKVCTWCGKKFLAMNVRKKNCSKTCIWLRFYSKYRAKKEKKSCTYCGKSFLPKEKLSGIQRFCSPACAMRIHGVVGAQNRRMKKVGRDEHVSIAEWIEILKKFSHRCVLCKSNAKPTMDHIVPLSMGGRHEVSNIRVLCQECNYSEYMKAKRLNKALKEIEG